MNQKPIAELTPEDIESLSVREIEQLMWASDRELVQLSNAAFKVLNERIEANWQRHKREISEAEMKSLAPEDVDNLTKNECMRFLWEDKNKVISASTVEKLRSRLAEAAERDLGLQTKKNQPAKSKSPKKLGFGR